MEITPRTRGEGRVSGLRSSISSSGHGELFACQVTHAKNGKDVNVYIKSALMHPSRQGRVQALGKTFSYNKFVRDLLELEVGLERLRLAISHREPLPACVHTLSSCFKNAIQSAHSCTLSKAFKHFSTC